MAATQPVNWNTVAMRSGVPRSTIMDDRDKQGFYSDTLNDEVGCIDRTRALFAMKHAGMSPREIRRALNLSEPEPTVRIANESSMTATDALEALASTIQRERGIPRTRAILAAVEARPDLWARYRKEGLAKGTRMVRAETPDEEVVR